MLSRRSWTDPEDERQACLAYAALRYSLETLARVAGTRGCIESSFEAARQQMGLDAHEVCSAIGWDRHMTMALLAMLRATTLPTEPRKQQPADSLTALMRSRELVAPA